MEILMNDILNVVKSKLDQIIEEKEERKNEKNLFFPKKHNVKGDCSICHDNFKENAFKLSCGHYFHYDCLKNWIDKKNSCPLCRLELLSDQNRENLKEKTKIKLVYKPLKNNFFHLLIYITKMNIIYTENLDKVMNYISHENLSNLSSKIDYKNESFKDFIKLIPKIINYLSSILCSILSIFFLISLVISDYSIIVRNFIILINYIIYIEITIKKSKGIFIILETLNINGKYYLIYFLSLFLIKLFIPISYTVLKEDEISFFFFSSLTVVEFSKILLFSIYLYEKSLIFSEHLKMKNFNTIKNFIENECIDNEDIGFFEFFFKEFKEFFISD